VQRRERRSHFVLRTDGRGADQLTTPLHYEAAEGRALHAGFMFMDGAAIMGFALREVPRLIDDVLRRAELSRDQVELFALHQANGFMLHQLRRMLGLPAERMPVNVRMFGNTGPSSIPLLLCQSYGDAAAPGTTLLCGFGVGLTYGAALVDLAGCRIAAPVEVETPP
jgi:3-oxoacyl-[acyl-carrier-protein] synthase III